MKLNQDREFAGPFAIYVETEWKKETTTKSLG